jgi:hypothetical protein
VRRFCAGCKQQRPIREFDLGTAQLSRICLGCADARLRTEAPSDRSHRAAQITTLEQHRRELYASLVIIDAQIADLRASALPHAQAHTQVAALERRRRELIAALVNTDAQIADLHARPTPSRIVLEDRSGEDDTFDDVASAADLDSHPLDEMG